MRMYISSVLESSIPSDTLMEICKDQHVLHSFAYYNPKYEPIMDVCKSLMMDSGAFTFMGKKQQNFDIKEYAKKYANYVKKRNPDSFIELDVESVYGFETYKDCLHILQDITGRDPIYVYHRWRGLEYFKLLVEKHKYIALSDVNTHTKNKSHEDYFPWLINYAHERGCKVHGLAYTRTSELGWIPFDSVDSSTWSAASRYAQIKEFNGHKMKTFDMKGHLISDSARVQAYSVKQWFNLSTYFDREYLPIW